MSREKQIEGMAKVASKCMTKWLNNETPKVLPDYIAEAFYNASYRKQSEGEWKQAYNSFPRYVCTNCNHLFNNKSFKYCPNCGAKMKGGAE